MSQAITIVAIVTGASETASEIEAAIKACVGPTRAEKGCLSYDPKIDPDTAGRYVFVENWESRAALEAHMQTPHLKTLAAAFKALGASLQVITLQPLD